MLGEGKLHHLGAVVVCSTLVLPQSAMANWFSDIAKSVEEAGGELMQNVGLGQTTDENGVKQDSLLGSVLMGAGACGGIAALLGKSGETTAKAAAACGAANGVVTALANSGRKDYAAKYEAITEDMAESESEIARLQTEARNNSRKADASESEIRSIISREKDDQVFLSKADRMRDELDDQISDVRRSQSVAQDKVHIIDGQISELDEIIEDSPDVADIEKTRIALQDQRRRLVDAVKASNNVERELVAQKQKLDTEIIERG